MTRNFMDNESIRELLSEVDAYEVKYWYENDVCGGGEFERLSDALFNLDIDEYLWVVADYISSEKSEQDFLEIIKEECWDVVLEPTQRYRRDCIDIDVHFVNCTIKFNEDDKMEDVVIAVGLSALDLEDDTYIFDDEDIFFYAEDVDDVARLFSQDNGEDFVIIEYDSVEE